MADGDIPQIEVSALPVTFDDSVVLLDVREPDEWQRGHVAGAQHIPLGDVPARIDEIDRDATLYVICHAGGRSQRVAQYLVRNGFEPTNVTGGMLSWVQAGRPVCTDDGNTGTV
ncbi:sulfurtransferase [Mycobacterium adipatum]|jgi:rhodanese-related sulfurtransferase|uniref:Sulfurtransferase n=1 Tax=Mycobacterium adipatum TaxID=1682113 RepID=A0A172UHS4_9MYCO|nr:rhodanese-like domain-containing protein [Mycobacterium adipatum]ANE78717.1 sulfurtransferase [Mycobacterium adipatum]MBI5737523.1 rhodanese-like domain-containing protein [Mycolicibacterium neoaurum]